MHPPLMSKTQTLKNWLHFTRNGRHMWTIPWYGPTIESMYCIEQLLTHLCIVLLAQYLLFKPEIIKMNVFLSLNTIDLQYVNA